MTIYELIPTDGHKSFYGKAKIVIDGRGIKTLVSYNTPIMEETNGIYRKLWDGWTTTTGRHIKAFSGLSKSEYLALPEA